MNFWTFEIILWWSDSLYFLPLQVNWLGNEGGSDITRAISNVANKLLSHKVQLAVNIYGMKGKERLTPIDEVIFGELSYLCKKYYYYYFFVYRNVKLSTFNEIMDFCATLIRKHQKTQY